MLFTRDIISDLKDGKEFPKVSQPQSLLVDNAAVLSLVFSLFSLFFSPVLFAEVSLELKPNQGSYSAGPYLSYIEDKDDLLELEQVQRLFEGDKKGRVGGYEVKQHYEDILSLGLSRSTYWIYLPFELDDSFNGRPDTWLLEIKHPLLIQSDLYLLDQGEVFVHQSQEELGAHKQYRNLVFELEGLEPKKYALILRVQSHAMITMPISLWQASALASHNQLVEYWLGFFFGIMMVMAFYNAVVFLVTRDRSYVYYVGYIVFSTLFFLVFTGVGNAYLWGRSPWVNEYLPLASSLMAMAFSLKFAAAFVSLEKISKAHNRLVNISTILVSLAAVVTFYDPYLMLLPTAVLSPFFTLCLLYIGIFARLKGSSAANILLVSFSVLVVSVFVFILMLMGVIPADDFSDLSLFSGSVIQVLVLSLGLANQINVERRKRYQALISENQAVQNMRRVETKSMERAMLDPLTGLPNRAALERFSQEHLDFKQENRSPLVVSLIYLQGYHEINHTLGFRSSDLLIEKVAARLNRIAGEFVDCMPLRLPGGPVHYSAMLDSVSFIVLFRLREEKQKYVNDVEHLLALLNRPIAVHDMMLEINARAGLSFSPEHSTNIFTLIRFAQAAVESDQEQEQPVVLYSSVVSQQAARKLKLINDLRGAIQHDELSLVFQPQLDIRAHKIVSLEALVRWRHPEFGEVGPSEFVILAEQAGLIDELTDWVIHNALESLLWLLEKGLKLGLSINISAKNLSQEQFAQSLEAKMDSFGLAPEALTLELTETSLMQNRDIGIKVLNDLHEAGFVIAIDDFGAGYSSLSYIKQLPLSELKIDKSFVSHIDNVHSDRIITKSTIALAHEMGARVCAEGVESASCLKILDQFDCDVAQGFHIAKPLSKEDLIIWVEMKVNLSRDSMLAIDAAGCM